MRKLCKKKKKNIYISSEKNAENRRMGHHSMKNGKRFMREKSGFKKYPKKRLKRGNK